MSYNEKHNEANGEDNRDGTDDNASWNSGEEGPTENAEVLALRERQMRNILATLLLSQGIPMLCGGDEVGRTQGGNNNAYCQDNEISWHAWPVSRAGLRQIDFVRKLIRLRAEQPVFHRRRFFQGRRIQGSEVKDLSWFRPDGKEMTEEEWQNGFTRCLGLRLAGDAIEELDDTGAPIVADTFLLLLNAHHEPIDFVLPAHKARIRWELVLDTRQWDVSPRGQAFRAGDQYSLEGRSLALLRLPAAEANVMSKQMTVHRAHHMPFGAEARADGTTRFRLWAPAAQTVELWIEDQRRALSMARDAGGWAEFVTREAPSGTRYRFRIDGDLLVPDPASRYQPHDVHGPSEVVDPLAHAWTDSGWGGVAAERLVFYELHVGAFSDAGTFAGVVERLDHLASLGVTVIELMPVGEFPGPLGLGLRRRPAVCAGGELRPSGGSQGAHRGLSRVAVSRCFSTSSTITSGPRATTSPATRPRSPAGGTRHPGATP